VKAWSLPSFSLPALRIALPAPPRVHVRAPRLKTRTQSPPLPLGRRVLACVRGLPDHAMLDRLVRGRAWIPVLGVMLAGIVFMQVEELKLGAAYGRAVQQTATLSAQNDALTASTGALGDTSRIESIAARLGLMMPAPSQTGFLNGLGDHLAAALAGMRAPDPNLYLNAAGTMNGAIAGTAVVSQGYAPASSSTTTTSGTSTSGTSTSSTSTSGTSTSGTVTSGTGTGTVTGAGATATGPSTTVTPPPTTTTTTTTTPTGGTGGAPLAGG
jgi:cell division protein FtsL